MDQIQRQPQRVATVPHNTIFTIAPSDELIITLGQFKVVSMYYYIRYLLRQYQELRHIFNLSQYRNRVQYFNSIHYHYKLFTITDGVNPPTIERSVEDFLNIPERLARKIVDIIIILADYLKETYTERGLEIHPDNILNRFLEENIDRGNNYSIVSYCLTNMIDTWTAEKVAFARLFLQYYVSRCPINTIHAFKRILSIDIIYQSVIYINNNIEEYLINNPDFPEDDAYTDDDMDVDNGDDDDGNNGDEGCST